MKRFFRLFPLAVLSGTQLFAQQDPSRLLRLDVVGRGPHEKIWQSVVINGDDSGFKTIRTNTYTEVATGLHYLNEGKWLETQEQFKELEYGFAATEGPHQVSLTKNINAPGSVELLLPDGQRLRSNPMGLSFYDYASGKNVLLGEVKDSEGALVAPNVVVFADAFTDIKGAIRYTYTAAGFEQDVILYDNAGIGTPADYGLDPNTTLLEMYSEFFSPPTPAKVSQLDKTGLQDERLEFGTMTIGSGVAYVLGGNQMEGAPVSKTWTQIDGRDFLVESVAFPMVKPLLDKAGMQARNTPDRKVVRGRERLVALSEMKAKSGATKVASARQSGPLPTKGFVIDYSTINSTLTNYTFQSDTTYYVSGPVVLSGTNTWWEGGSVIKFAPTNSANIRANTPMTWQSAPYRPVVMTARDDNSIGEGVGTNTLSGYYATTALYFDANTANTNANLHNLRISYAQKGISINGKSGHVLSHVQMVNCQNGIGATNADFSLRNALMHNVLTNFTGSSSTGRVEHLTVDTATWLNKDIGSNLFITNSLLVAVSNYGSYSSNSVSSFASASGVFTAVGGGAHYLSDNSYRNSGTAVVTILSDLRKMTTYPPLVTTNTYFGNITLSPQAQRDTDLPDRGYHYDPIDYAVNTMIVTNASLILTNGVAVAAFGTTGIWMPDGSHLYCEGSPLTRNHLTRYSNVQEQSTNWGSATVSTALMINPYNYGSTPATAEFRFTDFDGFSGYGYHIYLTDTNWVFSSLVIRDCTFNDGKIWLNGYTNSTLALNNNLFERVSTSTFGAPQLGYYNNLHRGGFVEVDGNGTNTFTFKDNAFESCLLENIVSIIHSNNAYINNGINRFTPNSTNDVVLSSFTYTNGPLGNYYQVSTTLYDAGSRNATNAGLYHHTVKTSQAKETNSIVDIGFHYVAVDGSGNPIDTDSDGMPDYLEDRNGNGSVNTGETDWQSGTDLGLKVWITEPKNNSNVP